MSFFKNLFNEATKFVEEHAKNLEKNFDEIKDQLGAQLNEALLTEQNKEQSKEQEKTLENKVFNQVFDDNQPTIKVETVAQKAEKEEQQRQQQEASQEQERKIRDDLAQLNTQSAFMNEFAKKPLAGVQASIAKYGLPKEKSFVNKKGETIYFNGELIFWEPAQDDRRGRAMYFEIIRDENSEYKTYISVTDVNYDSDNGEIREVTVKKTVANHVYCNPHDKGYTNFSSSDMYGYNHYLFMLYSGANASKAYYGSVKADWADEIDANVSTSMSFYLHSLEDAYALAGRIFFVLGESNQLEYADFVSGIIDGTFVKLDLPAAADAADYQEEEEGEEESNDYADNSTSSSSSSSNKKENKKEANDEIQIEVQNTSGEQIFITYEGSVRGSAFLGVGSVTRYKVKPGDQIKSKKTGAVLVSISASTKSGQRFKI